MSIGNKNLEVHRKPKITPLDQGRRRLERWFKIKDAKQGERTDVLLQIFGGFGLKDGAVPTGSGLTAEGLYPGAVFDDLTLVEEYVDEVFTQTGQSYHILYQRYETLTASWEKGVADKPGATENGLRTLVRELLADPGTAVPYDEDDIGVATITSNGKTLYLAGFEDDSDNMRGRFITRWAQAGQLRLRKSFDLEGLETLTYEFIGVEGTVDGRVTDRDIGNYEGFRTYVVETLRKIGGSSVVDNEVVESFEAYVPFTYPGVANAIKQTVTATPLRDVYDVELDHPVTADILATVEIRYQNDALIGTLPYSFWSPKQWAKMAAYWLTNNLEPTSRYESLNNYRVGTASQSYTGGATQVSFLGRFVYASGGSADIVLSGGPSNPVGTTYVIGRPKIEHAFTEVEPGGGIVKWYKRTIVYATIPAQS